MLDVNEKLRQALRVAIPTINYENSATRFMSAMRRGQFYLKYGYDPNQPRVPAGNADGGQWTGDRTSDLQSRISAAIAQTLSGQPPSYNECLDLCYPLLEKPKPPGSDRNYWDFHKCMDACLGRNI